MSEAGDTSHIKLNVISTFEKHVKFEVNRREVGAIKFHKNYNLAKIQKACGLATTDEPEFLWPSSLFFFGFFFGFVFFFLSFLFKLFFFFVF